MSLLNSIPFHTIYDRFGNRTVVNVGGYAADNSPMVRDGLANLAYNATNNRITTSGFEYDSAGNQTKAYAEDGTTLLRFEYDATNRMIAVRKDSDNSLWETQEFGFGNDRISQFNYATNLRTYYYGSIEYTESNNSGILVWSKSYVYFGDSILSTITNNGNNGETVEYNHPDRLGTKVVTNQQAGTSIEQNALPFGTALGAESSGATAKRFTSYERSTRTGLDYAQNRTYDSKQGRFTQVDPIGMGSSSLIAPQTLNLYSYCGNDPINRVDPDGLFWGAIGRFFKKAFKWIMVAIVVAIIVLAIVASHGTLGGFFSALGKMASGILGFSKGIDGVVFSLKTFAINTSFLAVGAISQFAQNKSSKGKPPCPPNIWDLAQSDWFKPVIEKAMAQASAKNQDRVDPGRYKEVGGWILQSPDGKVLEAWIKPSEPEPTYSSKWGWSRGDTAIQVFLDNPRISSGVSKRLDQGWKIVGEFHTHPDTGDSVDQGDINRTIERKIPGVIIGLDGKVYPVGKISRGIWKIGIPKGCK